MPKVYRVNPSMGALPTQARNNPIKQAISPLTIESPHKAETNVSEKRAIEKYSNTPKLKEIAPNTGVRKHKTRTPIMVPIKENTIETDSAFHASPLSAIGPPSNTVATEAGVPGIFKRIADINPPDIPPI